MSQKIPRSLIGAGLALIALGVVIGVLWIIARRPDTTVYEAAAVGAGLASIPVLGLAIKKIQRLWKDRRETKL